MGLGASKWGWGLLCGDGDPPQIEGGGVLNGAGGVQMGLGALMWGWRPPRLRVGGCKWGWARQNGAGGSYVGMETPQIEGRGL